MNKKQENYNKEEWGGWKIVSKMLDNPDKNEIYPTSECYQKLYEFVCEQKDKALKAERQSIIDKAELKGAGKILDMLWSNSANEKHMDKRIELELIYFFGKNWSKDMYNFIDEEKNYPNMKSIKTLKEIKSLK